MRRSDHDYRMALTNPLFLLRLAALVSIVLGCVIVDARRRPKVRRGIQLFRFDHDRPAFALAARNRDLLHRSGRPESDLAQCFRKRFCRKRIQPMDFGLHSCAKRDQFWPTRRRCERNQRDGQRQWHDLDAFRYSIHSNATPVGIVYDQDGSVTDALLGAGAGGASQCFTNAVFGGNDNYSSFGTYQHALIVINGECAQQSSQLTEVEYRLVRVIGSVLGLGWSQLNLNVQTGSPTATSDDYLGFPVMHFSDAANCVPITRCYANPYRISMDDAAAISRLYPVTTQNVSSFPASRSSPPRRLAFMDPCGLPMHTVLQRSPCRESTSSLVTSIRAQGFLRAAMRRVPFPDFSSPETPATRSPVSTIPSEIPSANGDRTIRRPKASSILPDCSFQAGRAVSISFPWKRLTPDGRQESDPTHPGRSRFQDRSNPSSSL